MFHKRVADIPSRLPSWYWQGEHHMATNWYMGFPVWPEYECVSCEPPEIYDLVPPATKSNP